jgi:hypothetical protein
MIWIIRNNIICKTHKENIRKTDRYATQNEVEKLPKDLQKTAEIYASEDNNRPDAVQKTTGGKEETTKQSKRPKNIQKTDKSDI